jgi:glucose-1-phosphate adenylyltransferase
VLILSGDHVYEMDYNVLYAFHAAQGAAVTVAVTEVPEEMVSGFGILETDKTGRVVGFQEKPRQASSRLASMGIYLFDRDSLIRWLVEDAERSDSSHDFGKNLLPLLVRRGEAVYAYRFGQYWQDVGTLDSYYESNLAFLSDQPPLDLGNPDWVIHTQSADRPPVRIEDGAHVERSLIANGCTVSGHVVRSVLFPGVTVPRGAEIRDSIVMHDTVLGRHAVVDHAIIDKEVAIGDGAVVGGGVGGAPNQACPEHLSSGLTVVGKGAQIAEGIKIGGNARIGAFVVESDFTGNVPEGGVVDGPESMH